MLSDDTVRELRANWLPHLTDAGLDRLITLLESASPLLIHGRFTAALPQGCLATHAGWHHPRVCHRTLDAGVMWLSRVAGLNPATSHVIRAWDRLGPHDLELRGDLLAELTAERDSRRVGVCA